MKQLLTLCLAAHLFSSCRSQPSATATMSSGKASAEKQSDFAVVELFTSQGCSSCPSADALLGKEIAAATKAGKKLIALSFHVDYWNRLGWTDPYSQHAFTERQYAYSDKLKLNGVYTPQAVVNGQWETVGSKQGTVENFIKQALSQHTEATVTISSAKPTGNHLLEVEYSYNGSPAHLNVAIVQHTIATPVKAGENDGRTLTNYNVVRSWKTTDAKIGSNTVQIELPNNYAPSDYSVIIYAQEKEHGKIVAADMR